MAQGTGIKRQNHVVGILKISFGVEQFSLKFFVGRLVTLKEALHPLDPLFVDLFTHGSSTQLNSTIFIK
jgi:hypothetical protein